MNREVMRKRAMADTRRQPRSARPSDDFVETVRHEFRTRLTSIAGSVSLLIGGAAGALPAPATRFLQIAHDNSQRLIALVDATFDAGTAPTDRAASNAAGGSARLRAVVQRRPRVLHVDDDRGMLHVVAQALRAEADIVSAHSIAEARQKLATGDVDLAVIDLTLTDGDGLDLLSVLHNRDGDNIPTVVFSGQDDNQDVAERVDAVFRKSSASLEQLRGILRQMAAENVPTEPVAAAARAGVEAVSREVA